MFAFVNRISLQLGDKGARKLGNVFRRVQVNSWDVINLKSSQRLAPVLCNLSTWHLWFEFLWQIFSVNIAIPGTCAICQQGGVSAIMPALDIGFVTNKT